MTITSGSGSEGAGTSFFGGYLIFLVDLRGAARLASIPGECLVVVGGPRLLMRFLGGAEHASSPS